MENNKSSFMDMYSQFFLVCQDKIEDKGEDSYAFNFNENAGLIGVFDGCGGSGGRRYKEFGDRTGAYLAARRTSECVNEWFNEWSNVLKDLLEVTPDEELKAVWEFAKEGEYVTGEYSEDKLIEFFLYMFFQNEWDDLNIDYKEEIDTCIDIVRKADVEIENISENELNTLKYQLSEELSKVMNGKNYPFSNWEDAKYVSFSTSQLEHKIILLMVLDDGRWKILSPIVQSLCEIYIKPEDKKERTDDNNADTLQNIINTQLQNLCFDEEIICYSDPTTYKTVDEILNNTNSIDNRYVFENMVLQNVPQKYMSGSEGNYSITTKQSGYTMYVIITGTMKDGYIARVKCAKDDPFIHER